MSSRSKTAILGGIVLFNIVCLALPTVIVLLTSFTAGNIIRFPPEGLSLRWYQTLLAKTEYQEAF
jgi:putative spermidine/putrescine transport system permease protein